MRVTPTGIAYVASALLLCATYGAVYRPLESSIVARYDELDNLRDDLARDRRIAAQAGDFARAAHALRASIGNDGPGRRPGETVARFLVALDTVAARDGIAVEAVAPRLPTLTQFAAAPPGTHPNDDLNLDLTLRGSYARVMRVVRTLDGRTAAVRLTVANLRVARLLPGSPTEIDATFHVTLLGADADATTPPVQHPS